MPFNQVLSDAKIQAELRIRDLQAKGFSKEAVRKTLNSHGNPFLDELVDYVFRSPLYTATSSPHATAASTKDIDFQRKFMEMAVNEARKCTPEDSRTHPRVGAVVVKGGEVLATAYRGELGKGEHAEFTVLEKKLENVNLVGATVYATLEPCTTRNHPKVPCARRLIERKVARVVFGMIDPNRIIQGEGWQILREANIGIGVFDDDLKSELEELNRDFTRLHRKVPSAVIGTSQFLEYLDGLSGDELYRLAMAVKERHQTISCGRNDPTAATLVSKGMLEPVAFTTDLKNSELPHTLPTPVWRYFNENRDWLIQQAIEKNQNRPDRLERLGAT